MSKFKKTPEKILKNKMYKLKKAGLKTPKKLSEKDKLKPLKERLKKLFSITIEQKPDPTKMLFLVMYDIENDKVRTEIAKYLIRKGCIRIQKSVYIANLKRTVFNDIHKTLKEIQQMYENNDSIILIPLPADKIKAMKIVGQQIDIELIIGNKNVQFF